MLENSPHSQIEVPKFLQKLFMILQLPRWLPEGKIGQNETPARDCECAHLDPTHMGGPAIVGCLHLDPAQLMQLSGVYIWTQPGYSNPTFHHQFYHGQISPSTVGVYISTQPSCYLQHHQCGDANQESESSESESLVMFALSLVISCKLSVLTHLCCEHELNSLKDLNTK